MAELLVVLAPVDVVAEQRPLLERGVLKPDLGAVGLGPAGGKGLDGVVSKTPGYFNPFLEPMMKGGAGK